MNVQNEHLASSTTKADKFDAIIARFRETANAFSKRVELFLSMRLPEIERFVVTYDAPMQEEDPMRDDLDEEAS